MLSAAVPTVLAWVVLFGSCCNCAASTEEGVSVART